LIHVKYSDPTGCQSVSSNSVLAYFFLTHPTYSFRYLRQYFFMSSTILYGYLTIPFYVPNSYPPYPRGLDHDFRSKITKTMVEFSTNGHTHHWRKTRSKPSRPSPTVGGLNSSEFRPS